ncbi:PucR family transcriptional regulator [Streptomyces sp. NPDC059169]|uniref:PucR family transcriptional regulator n=1 Tax=Streptomyces sp. NPDC059169 TaxID=3346754 RepID=UPI0036C00957
MRLTLRSLVAHGELRLRPVVASEQDRPIRWAHISELDDPTPYLEGGEVLLTMGLQQRQDDQDWADYVARLVLREVSALGFGVGTRHNEIPAALVAAARRTGLPLFEVPGSTPFIAITEAVAGAVARDEQLALTDALDAQRGLIRAALAPRGAREVTTRLSRALKCWVVLLDPWRRLRCCAPKSARKHVGRVVMDIERLGLADPQRSAALAIGADTVTVVPLVVHGGVGGFLVTGRPAAFSQTERSVLTTAVGLLSLDLYSHWDLREQDRRTRAAVLHLAVTGHPELAMQLAEILGLPFPEPPLRVAALDTHQKQLPDLLRSLEEHQGLRAVSALIAAQEPDPVLVLLSAAEGDTRSLEEVLVQVPGSRGAVSGPVPLSELADVWRKARAALRASSTTTRLVIAQDFATAGLLSHLRTQDAQGWASALLEPLDRYAGRSKLDLVATLRVFLANNGLVDASAVMLGIHRHTLRYRLNRIAELLRCNLEDPTVRAELWIALRMRDQF